MSRDDKVVLAEEARATLNNPAFQRAITAEELSVVSTIANHKSDGSEASQRYQLQLCMELQTINAFKRRMGILADTTRLTEAQRVQDV